METKARQAYLYDFYGELLNEHQRKIYEDYAFSDLSLGEIAAEEGISRQGVHDLIRRCSKKLEEYEGKLHLVEKFLFVKDKVEEIQNIAACKPEPEMREIASISNEILEEL
ncbi:MAG: DNA-binding protein [Roseburia sp.]|nr:DNA-binding protein [Roseburia sp.]